MSPRVIAGFLLRLRRAIRVRRAMVVIAVIAAMQSAAIAHAAEELDRSILPGIGPQETRTPVDPNRSPWRAVGKLQANAANLHVSCTGSLIGASRVLTAAHCLVNPRTGQYFAPSSFHFLIGYARGDYAGHARAVAFAVAPGYDPSRPTDSYGSDWAVLTIDTALGTPDRVLKIRDRIPASGTMAMVGGYPQDHPLVLNADRGCKIIAVAFDAHGNRLLRHDCAATRGVSGAPLLVRQGPAWRIAGVAVAAGFGVPRGVAADVEGVNEALLKTR